MARLEFITGFSITFPSNIIPIGLFTFSFANVENLDNPSDLKFNWILGVKTSKFDIIKNGVLEDLQTNREIASFAGRNESNGCSFADTYYSFPLQRMPNVSLLPNYEEDLSLSDMLNMMGDGLYIKGDGSWSIDMQRYNFQFTGNIFYKVKSGKIAGMVKDVSYQSNTQDFWKNCIEVGGESTYSLEGAFNCGKGQPSQVAPVSHGAPLSLFKDIKVLNTKNENW